MGQQKPDIVMVVLDDMRDTDWQALPKTRALGGLWFPNFTTSNPQCGPSRTTLLTGMHSHNHGVEENDTGNGVWSAFNARKLGPLTLGPALRKAGYQTSLVGKFLNDYDCPTIPPGWDDWHAFDSPAYLGPVVCHNGTRVNHPDNEYSTDVITKNALDFLDKPNKAPLFLYYAPYAPHSPAIPKNVKFFPGATVQVTPAFNEDDITDKPAQIRNRAKMNVAAINEYERDRLGTLRTADESIVRLVNMLKSRNRWANTIMFVLSDNGYCQGTHRWETKGQPYACASQIPMLVIGPGFQSGAIDQRLVCTADVPTTVAKIAGAALPRADGRDLRFWFEREHVLIESAIGTGWKARRTGHDLYVERGTGEKEYYDLDTDPYELDNLMANWLDHTPTLDAQTQAFLAGRLQELRNCSGATCG